MEGGIKKNKKYQRLNTLTKYQISKQNRSQIIVNF